MEKIVLPKNKIIYLNHDIQKGSKGKDFRLSGCSKVVEKEKWINKELKNHWIYWFVYTDKSGYFGIEIDFNDNFYKLH